jgi:hypothetical protein
MRKGVDEVTLLHGIEHIQRQVRGKSC